MSLSVRPFSIIAAPPAISTPPALRPRGVPVSSPAVLGRRTRFPFFFCCTRCKDAKMGGKNAEGQYFKTAISHFPNLPWRPSRSCTCVCCHHAVACARGWRLFVLCSLCSVGCLNVQGIQSLLLLYIILTITTSSLRDQGVRSSTGKVGLRPSA